MPVLRGVDQGREGPQGPLPEPLPPLPWRNYGAGQPEAYVPMPEPMPDAPRALEPFRLLLLPYDVQQQYRLRRGYAAPDVPDDEILDGVLHDVNDRATTWQRLWQGLKTPPLLAQVGIGAARQVRERFAPSPEPYVPRTIAEGLAAGLVRGLVPTEEEALAMSREPALAPFLAVPGLGGPMRAVKTGYEGAVAGAVAARAAAEAGRAVAGARRAVARAGRRVAGARPAAAAADELLPPPLKPAFTTERQGLDQLNELLEELDNIPYEQGVLKEQIDELAWLREPRYGMTAEQLADPTARPGSFDMAREAEQRFGESLEGLGITAETEAIELRALQKGTRHQLEQKLKALRGERVALRYRERDLKAAVARYTEALQAGKLPEAPAPRPAMTPEQERIARSMGMRVGGTTERILQTPSGEPVARLRLLTEEGRGAGTYEIAEWLGGGKTTGPYGPGGQSYSDYFRGRAAARLIYQRGGGVSREGAPNGYLQLTSGDEKYLSPVRTVEAGAAPRIGGTGPAVQAGMGIGERPAQGTLMAAQGAPDITPPPQQAPRMHPTLGRPLTTEELALQERLRQTNARARIAPSAPPPRERLTAEQAAEATALERELGLGQPPAGRVALPTEAAGARGAAPPGAAPPRWGGPPSRPPGMGGGGWLQPPVEPPLPAPGSAIQAHLEKGMAQVEHDRPGTFTRMLDYLPGTRQLLRKKLLPALAQRPGLTASWIGEGRALTVVGARQALGRRGQFALVEKAFGKGSLADDFKPKGVEFLGAAEQRAVNAAGDITGTMVDIAERPHLYALSDARRNALRLAQTPRTRLLQETAAGYNLEVKPYPTQPGGMHVAHVDKAEDAIKMAGSLDAALTRGRLEERLYATLADRMRADPTFQPVTSLGELLIADDAALARAAAKQTFLEGSGGLTRLEMLTKTHPELAGKMVGLKKRLTSLQGALSRLDEKQAQAIEKFLSSPLEETQGVRQDLTELQAALNPKIKRPVFVKKGVAGEPDIVRVLPPGPHFGKDIKALESEIQSVKAQLAELSPQWRLANPKPYSLVQEAGYRYFPGEEAQIVRELRKNSDNAFLRFLDELRATAFGGDFSPVTIQGMTWLFADPIGASRLIVQGKFSFSEAALVRDMQARPEFWRRFMEWTGVNPLGGVGKEFATGFVGKVPKVGKHWEAFNEGLYRPLVRAQAEIFETSYQGALRRGLTDLTAGAVATDDAMKMIPRIDYRRLGMSSAQMDTYRPLLTSVSFLTQPALLMNDATKGLLKLGLKMTVTPNESFAMQRVLTLVATTEALSVASNVLYAQQHGLDVEEAVKESLNPDSGKFMSLIFPNGSKIGLGGPFRALIRGVAPRPVDWSPVPVPFVGLSKFAESKVGPGLQVLYQEARNRAYTGEQIRTGKFPINILQGLQYALEGSLPLTVGETARDIRKGVSPEEVGVRAISQFGGTNYVPETLTLTRERVAAQMYPIDSEKEPWRQEEPYLGLKPTERAKVREHPLVKEQMAAQIDYRGKSDEAVRAAREQHFDDVRAVVDYAAESYMKAGEARAAGELDRKQFRDRIKEIAAVKREGIMAQVQAFKAFAEEHNLGDFEEIAPDAVLRADFLSRYNDPNLFDQASGDWDYNRRESIRTLEAEQFGRETVERWLREGARETHPLVQAWWDGLETFRTYFQTRQEMLSHAPQELRQEIAMLEEASRTSEAAVYAILQKSASPEAVKWERTIAALKRELRRTMPGLDAWLFDYGYVNAPVGAR